jgi:NAD+ kinase
MHIRNWGGDDYIITIGLVLNINKKDAFIVVEKVIRLLKEKGVSYLIDKESAQILGEYKKGADYLLLREKVDVILLFGGDGTFLHTAHNFIGANIPLLGINLGRLGFLTEIEISELEYTLQNLIEKNYCIEKRMLLEAKIIRNNREIYNGFALNDIVINRGARSRMISVELFINDEFINIYRADGIIMATPTGSTAYSLSAGGPIVNPRIRAILITPICPHSLLLRPMVISDLERIKVIISGEENMKITADGRNDLNLLTGDIVNVSASDKEISLVKLADRTFYSILHKKMRAGLV